MTEQNKNLDELLNLLELTAENLKYNKFFTMFPDTGKYARENYPKHVKFINCSARYSQSALIGGNRIGKSTAGCYILTAHLTGLYPDWWKGRKFYAPTHCWAVGKTSEKTQEILQNGLLGENLNDIGTGMIPKHLLVGKPKRKQGSTDCVYSQRVKHVSGGLSLLTFKAYTQYDEGGFEGTKIKCILLDEEPEKAGVYSECLMRLIDEHSPGEIRCTFTPLFSDGGIYEQFIPDTYASKDGSVPTDPDKFALQVGLDDVPHLPQSEKEKIIKGCLPHEVEARSKGIRTMGAGAVYPVEWEKILIDPIPIPTWWPKVYGFDTGWKHNAAIWIAKDPDTNTYYAYAEYYAGYQPAVLHAAAIKAKSNGDWMTGAADALAVNQNDGTKMIEEYLEQGLNLIKANKANRDSGILKVLELFRSGRLFIFATLENLIRELRKYRRDEDNQIIKKDDHGCDAIRYALTTGCNYMDTEPTFNDGYDDFGSASIRNKYTGY